MDRLTKRGFDPELEFCAECDYHGEPNGCNRARGDCSAYTVFTEAYTRLAAYEDTGLTPDEIAALRDENDRLCAALKLAQARAADMEAEVERLRARWEETASDNTDYHLSHSDGIYTVSDQNGHVVCEFIRASEEAARAALEGGQHGTDQT